jgi:TM2 domain-containing membrane protein YozV
MQHQRRWLGADHLEERVRGLRRQRNLTHPMAGLVSLIMPGAGQFIEGRVGSGLLWFGANIGLAAIALVRFEIPAILLVASALGSCVAAIDAATYGEHDEWNDRPRDGARVAPAFTDGPRPAVSSVAMPRWMSAHSTWRYAGRPPRRAGPSWSVESEETKPSSIAFSQA